MRARVNKKVKDIINLLGSHFFYTIATRPMAGADTLVQEDLALVDAGAAHPIAEDLATFGRVAKNVLGITSTTATATPAPAVLQLHLHRDVTNVTTAACQQHHAPSSMTTTMTPEVRQRMQRQVGLGAVVGQCCECRMNVIDDGNDPGDEANGYFVCSPTCGAVLWHRQCAQRRLGRLRHATEIRQTCPECAHVLNVRRVFGGPTRFATFDDAVGAAPRHSVTIAWVLYVLASLHLLWPIRVLFVLLRFVYYVVRYPFVALYVTPYLLGVVMKFLIYTHAVFGNDMHTAQSSGTSFSSYRFVWHDETGRAGIHSDGGFHYDVGHWLFGVCLQLIVVGFIAFAYVAWLVLRYTVGTCWARARTALVAQSIPTRAA